MEIQEIKMFQFYLSSIKSYGGYGSRVYNPLFQFYLSSIKSCWFCLTGFNSTLVQLKVSGNENKSNPKCVSILP